MRPLLILALATAAFTGAADVAQAKNIVDRKVSFSVTNSDQTGGPGATDNKRYTIAGRMIGPRSELRKARAGRPAETPAATIYLHGLGYTSLFYHFTQVPQYDFVTKMAKQGHLSVIIDRIGYGKSGKPDGMDDSYAAQATVLHQIIQSLRDGEYEMAGNARRPAVFKTIGVAAHSAAVFIAQLEDYSFDDADALVLMSLGDLFPSPLALTAFAATSGVCFSGGDLSDGDTGSPGYAYFGQTDADFQAAHLYNIDPRVAAIITAHRVRDPCGESGTALTSILSDATHDQRIRVPVLLLNGKNDALFPPPAGNIQKVLFQGVRDLTQVEVPDTGHALLLGRTAPIVREKIDKWLSERGL
ncbi:MAG: hypothetical protein QOG62_528 [Thermoleophilaceae bacterium]|jgi:pimeloyl-ACP methyl ester carboxylesterase|nr:hypothetical protein [Thermoleophilaceae bacterium]